MLKIIAAVTAVAAAAATIVATAGGADAATTWQAHDKNCRTAWATAEVEAGEVCAEVQKRVTDSGSVTGYRGRLIVTPNAGQSITPDHYVWQSHITKYCSTTCAPKTTAWTSSWSAVETSETTYVGWGTSGELGYGFDVGASRSAWTKVVGKCVTYTAGKVCVNRLERGYRTEMQERGQLLVNPASGQWIEPRWVRVGRVIDGKTTSKTVDLCDPSCTRRTEYKSSSVYNSPISGYDEGFAYASWALPSGVIKSLRVAYP